MLNKFKPVTPGLRGTVLVSKKHLSKEQEFEIKKIGEPGLIFQNSIKRVYPQNNLFSQVTGFMSRHGEPQSKLELNLNESLSEGNDIVLTLDMKIQNIIVICFWTFKKIRKLFRF